MPGNDKVLVLTSSKVCASSDLLIDIPGLKSKVSSITDLFTDIPVCVSTNLEGENDYGRAWGKL
jgi:hypothetical protein